MTPSERKAETERVNQFLDQFHAGRFSVNHVLTTHDISLLLAAALRLERQRAATRKAGSQRTEAKRLANQSKGQGAPSGNHNAVRKRAT